MRNVTTGDGGIGKKGDNPAIFSGFAYRRVSLSPAVRECPARDGHTLLLVAPAWVRTDMGGSDASLPVEEGIPLVVDIIEANRGKSGLCYVDRFTQTFPRGRSVEEGLRLSGAT